MWSRSGARSRSQFPRVYPIVDTSSLEKSGINPQDAAHALLQGGARILQLRHKGFWSSEVLDIAAAMAELCGAGADFIINDRADYAALLGAGLHVGQEDLLPVEARTVVGNAAVLGYSTHNLTQLAAKETEPADYLAFGPVFVTGSKTKADPVVGLDLLRLARELTDKPLVGIGGIIRTNAPDAWATGIDSVAVIADLLPVPCSAAAIQERMREWCRLAE